MSNRVKTARCVLASTNTYLLVMHRSWRGKPRGRWGLPGGRIEYGEAPDTTAHRELNEELSVRNQDLIHIGDYDYKGAQHRIYGAELSGTVGRIDRAEIADIAWLTMADVAEFDEQDKLHAGFELAAIERYADLRETL